MNLYQIQIKFEAYLLTEKRASKNTFLSYQKDLNQFIEFIERNNISFDVINGDELKKFVHYLHGLKLSPASVSRKISTLKTFFSYIAINFGIKNYAKELYFPKRDKRLPSYLTQDEVSTVLSYSEQDKTSLGIRN